MVHISGAHQTRADSVMVSQKKEKLHIISKPKAKGNNSFQKPETISDELIIIQYIHPQCACISFKPLRIFTHLGLGKVLLGAKKSQGTTNINKYCL